MKDAWEIIKFYVTGQSAATIREIIIKKACLNWEVQIRFFKKYFIFLITNNILFILQVLISLFFI